METNPGKKNDKSKNKTETVLLRYPTPKYNFQGRKLNKTDIERREEDKLNSGTKKTRQHVSTALSTQKDEKTELSESPKSVTKNRSDGTSSVNQSTSGGNGVTPTVGNVSSTNTNSSLIADGVKQKSNASLVAVTNVNKPVNVVTPATAKPVRTSSVDTLYHPTNLSPLEQAQQNEVRLNKEIESLRSQLEVQLQVNSELKRLFLASMGEDLEHDVEKLARDKAQLSLELGDHMRKMTSDYENLDKISIQADMWRSKFLASRVMIDELANGKAFYSLQYQESQDALQQLLNERHEIRTNLLGGYKCLQQVKDAFDPLNTHQSIALPSTNIIDLAKQTQQLSEVIRYRLLPAGAKVTSIVDIETNWQDRLTPAEFKAHEVIMKDACPTEYRYQMPPALLGPKTTDVGRYHPHTNYDNLTYNCCAKCKGEITIM